MKRFLALLAVSLTFVACSEAVDYPTAIGKLKTKQLSEVHNNLAVGCETLDRDYADYHAYKEYLAPLGMRYIRLQAGWAKTEQKPGVYDFAWLDAIIDDAVSRGLEPWLELSYGNPIYPGGGTKFLMGGWPTSKVAVEAWCNWVRASAERYKGKVHQWEVWNEPDITIRRNNYDPQEIVDLAILTSRIIKEVDPTAKIAVYGIASGREVATADILIGSLAAKLKSTGEEHLVDWVSYHGYQYEPELSYFIDGDSLRKVLRRHNFDIDIWQGESGAPSVGYMGGALGEYDWSEQTQAKWDIRKMMNDHGNGVRTSIFSISDMNYSANDEVKMKNYKGLLSTDENSKVIRPKMAYYAVQNFVAVFDNLDLPCDIQGVKVDTSAVTTPHRKLVYLFSDRESELQSIVLWRGGATPIDGEWSDVVSVEVANFNCKKPLCVDLLTGVVYKIPYRKEGDNFIFDAVPYYDSPVVVCDRSLVEVE